MIIPQFHERKIPLGGPWIIHDIDTKGPYDYKIFSKNSQKFLENSIELQSGDMISIHIESHEMITSDVHVTLYITNGTHIIPMQWHAPEKYLENSKKLLI